MKHNLLNCYIDNKMSAFMVQDGNLYFMSHSAPWDDGTRLGNMVGWRCARYLCPAPELIAKTLDPDTIRNLLRVNVGFNPVSIILEGSAEYAEKRANKQTRTRHAATARRVAKPATEPTPEPAPAPMPEPVPEPAPVVTKIAPAEIVHDKYSDLLKIIRSGSSVYLYGPAGSGKNHVAEQIARALGLEFYYQNSITDEYKLIGFIDGAGNYHETEFYRAFTKGGVFMLDEMDASCPDTLVTLNAALANGYFTFPGGRVQMHPDFHCIAAGNTCGRGATEEYSGRSVLDAASLNRFVPVRFDYCPAIERKLAGAGGSDILEFIRDMRQAAANARIHIVLGYRNIQRLAKFSEIFDTKTAVEYAVTGGYDRDEINILRAGLHNKNNRFALAM